ncbi:MFS transporter [Methylocella silvestris]|uniref:MFS transporter n=1 Tax=Methylocella silvestris TaxID=199596 RepID=A0A2J7TCD2_METSI|nr:MFS transporter [Methylocella silvestris]
MLRSVTLSAGALCSSFNVHAIVGRGAKTAVAPLRQVRLKRRNVLSAPRLRCAPPKPCRVTRCLTLFLAAACGLIVANLYYAQPIAANIGADLRMSESAVGLLVTFTQIGYGLGLVLIVPLGDVFENRRLIAFCLAGSVVALTGFALAPTAAAGLSAALLLGLACVSAQIIVPYAAQLASEDTRGRVVGDVMSGLLAGIMLARPMSSFLTHWLNWRAIFFMSAALMAGLSFATLKGLPTFRPLASLSYFGILRSLFGLLRDTPLLRQRIAYQAPLFAAFSVFWTASPLLLLSPAFNLTQQGVALFALLGAGGAIMAPIAGRAADRGGVRLMTGAAIGAVVLSFGVAWAGGAFRSLPLLAAAALILDMGVSANLILSQRALFALGSQARGRLNGLFIAAFFLGGALGSALSTLAYARGGWPLASAAGGAFSLLAFCFWLTEIFTRKREI